MDKKSVKGTETEKNLLKAFSGESQAKNRYTFFAKQAKQEGYEQIAAIFEETALQEEQHAKTFFRFLEGGMVEITGTFPAGIIGTTAQNLMEAAAGENEEANDLYPKWADVAEAEGFKDIAVKFRMIARVESEHEERYKTLLHRLERNETFERPDKVKWQCRKCGYVHYGERPPMKCPSCDHPQAYFQVKPDNY